jgi:putative copper resistance protein D
VEADGPLIAIRFALYLTLGALFGLSAFGLYALTAHERVDALRLRPWLVGNGVLAFLFAAVALALPAAAMAGTPAWPVDREAVGMLLAGSAVGTAWEVRMAALAVASIVATRANGRTVPLGVVAFAAAIAVATPAWAGHGAIDEGVVGRVHLLADILHLLAAGAWVGALLGLLLLVTPRAHRIGVARLGLVHRAMHGFGMVGTIVDGTIIVTGVVRRWLLVGAGRLPTLPATRYG